MKFSIMILYEHLIYAFVNLANLNQKSTPWTWINSIFQSYSKQQNKIDMLNSEAFLFTATHYTKLTILKLARTFSIPADWSEEKQIEQETTVVIVKICTVQLYFWLVCLSVFQIQHWKFECFFPKPTNLVVNEDLCGLVSYFRW